MSETLCHKVVLKHDEVMRASMAARSRAISGTWLGIMLGAGLFAAIWAGHLFAFWLVQQLPFPMMFAIGSSLPTVIPALFALIAVITVASTQGWATRRAYLRNFTRLGIPKEIEAQFEILPDGLRVATERVTITPRWHAIDTIEWHDRGWVLSADQLTFLLPRASFVDEAAERTFLAALVDKLSPEARGRSPKAVAFADGSALA